MLLNTLRVAMAELHLTDIDDEVLARLERRAKQEDRSVEHLVQEELERALSFSSSEKVTEEASFVQAVERLRATSPEKRVPDVEAVEIEGIPASELLIRDRRRR
jgi:plasmid stability protein